MEMYLQHGIQETLEAALVKVSSGGIFLLVVETQ